MRILALAPRTSILYYVAFVDRGDVRRVISLRALTDGRSHDMSKSSNKTPIRMPGVAEDRKITAAAKADPDTQPLTEAQLAQMVPAKALRGRPPLATRIRSQEGSPCFTTSSSTSVTSTAPPRSGRRSWPSWATMTCSPPAVPR